MVFLFIWDRGSQSVLPEPVASASSGNLDTQILRLYPSSTKSETWGEVQQTIFTSFIISGDFDVGSSLRTMNLK